jgi:hypothetical protein
MEPFWWVAQKSYPNQIHYALGEPAGALRSTCREFGMAEAKAPCQGLQKIDFDGNPDVQYASQLFQKKIDDRNMWLVEKVSQSNAYLTYMAMASLSSDAVDRETEAVSQMSRDQRNLYDRVKAKVEKRRSEIDFTNKASFARLRCNSLKALVADYNLTLSRGARTVNGDGILAGDAKISAQ